MSRTIPSRCAPTTCWTERFPQQTELRRADRRPLGDRSVDASPVSREGDAELAAGPARDRRDRELRTYYASGDRSLVSPDGHATMIPVTLTEPGEDHVEDVLNAVEQFDSQDGFETAITGEFTFDHDFGEVSERDLQNGELRLGLPAALIVLVIVFGALVAASLPLLLALVSIASRSA